jgi:hypothetical protein
VAITRFLTAVSILLSVVCEASMELGRLPAKTLGTKRLGDLSADSFVLALFHPQTS